MKCLFTVLTALLWLPTSASAFYAESQSNDMAGEPVPIAYDTTTAVEFRVGEAGMPGGDGSEVDSIAAAFATWAAVDCVSIDFVQGAREADPGPRHWTRWALDDPSFERYINVYWSDDPAEFPDPTVAFFGWAHDGNGVLIGGSIIFNSLHHDWSTTGAEGLLDVQSVATAMVGRVLGLTSAMEGNATYPRYVAGDTSKRVLGEDDIAGITYIYGDDTCAARGVPEGICLGTPREDCPPALDVDAGAGTRDGGGPRDTSIGTPDTAAATGDGGVGDGGGGAGDDGGCSVGAIDTEGTPGWLALLLFVALALTRMKR